MIILSRPSSEFKFLLNRRSKHAIQSDDLIFYSQGRDALLSALNAFKIKPGDTVIIPAYICESSIEPLRTAGYKIVFIDINSDLNLDQTKVYDAVKRNNAKAVLVINYFGFSSNTSQLVDLLNPLGVWVIEDCCHSFLSFGNGQIGGSEGNAAIYSMRKTLPIPDGGALRINIKNFNNKIISKNSAVKPKIVRYLIIRMLETIVINIGWPNIYSPFFDKIKNILKTSLRTSSCPNKKFVEPLIQFPSSLLTSYLSDKKHLDNIKGIIIKNYILLSKGLIESGLKPYCPNLPKGCVPQWMVFYDSSQKIVEWLRKHGVGASYWPWHELPEEVVRAKDVYKVSNKLNSKLALLPLHHSMGHYEVNYIIRLINKLQNDKLPH